MSIVSFQAILLFLAIVSVAGALYYSETKRRQRKEIIRRFQELLAKTEEEDPTTISDGMPQ